MKLLISILVLLITQPARASKLNIYYANGHESAADKVIEIYKKKYQIPEILILKMERSHCTIEDKRILELCITKKGELKVLSSTNINVLKKSFEIFRQP